MTTRLQSKVIVVTGATSGIGRAVAERLAREGASVVLGARRKDVGDSVAAAINDAGGHAVFVPTDVTVEDQVAALVRAAVDQFGRLDGAFNNAGGVNAFGPVSTLDESAWRADLQQNLDSVFFGSKYQIPAIAASGGGAILNNASNLGLVGMANVAPYVAAKHAVIGLTRATALEAADQAIRINALVSGAVDTPAFRASMGATPEQEAQIAALHPLGRIAQAEEIAAFVAFLLSAESRFITGAALAIDGGFTAR